MQNALILKTNQLSAVADNFDAYVAAIADIPTLTVEEEQALAQRFFEYNDIQAAQQLVLSHLKYVVHIARGFAGYGLPLMDLVQEGNIGLMKAVKRFDPSRGVRLISFAVHWIKSEINDYIIKNWRIVKVATTKAQRKLFFNLRSSKSHTGWLNAKETENIANELGVSVEEVTKMESRLSGRDIAFDLSGDEEDSANPVNWLADEVPDPLMVLENEDYEEKSQQSLGIALSQLDQRSQDIVRRRWMVDEDESKPTLHDLAKEYGVSAERIRQIETQALKKLKNLLVA